MSVSKVFISANDLLLDSFRLAKMIHESGFRPDVIVGVWRGDAPIAIAVHEYFDFKGVSTLHCAIKASSYYGIEQQHSKIEISGLDEFNKLCATNRSVLLVDDVFDSGRSYQAIRERLKADVKRFHLDVRLASIRYKPENNQTDFQSDFHLKETDSWLVFTHELCGLNKDEVRGGKDEEIVNVLN